MKETIEEWKRKGVGVEKIRQRWLGLHYNKGEQSSSGVTHAPLVIATCNVISTSRVHKTHNHYDRKHKETTLGVDVQVPVCYLWLLLLCRLQSLGCEVVWHCTRLPNSRRNILQLFGVYSTTLRLHRVE